MTLRVEAPDGVPPVHADPGLIERVLDNLIGNALQHTPSGGSVSVGVRADGSRKPTTGCYRELESPFM